MRLSYLAMGWMVAALAVGCTSQLEPAQKMLGDVTAMMAELPPEASTTMPGQFAEVQRRVAELQSRFDHEDYRAVMTEGPAVLVAAHTLGQAAATHKAEVTQQLTAIWAQRAGQLPDELSAIEQRLAFLAAPANRKAAAGTDLKAAQDEVRDEVSLWSKGQSAYAAGNLPEAVQTANAVQSRADALAQSLGVNH